jgi:hypothetical protein
MIETGIIIMCDIGIYMLAFKARVGHEPSTFTCRHACIGREGNFGKFLV